MGFNCVWDIKPFPRIYIHVSCNMWKYFLGNAHTWVLHPWYTGTTITASMETCCDFWLWYLHDRENRWVYRWHLWIDVSDSEALGIPLSTWVTWSLTFLEVWSQFLEVSDSDWRMCIILMGLIRPIKEVWFTAFIYFQDMMRTDGVLEVDLVERYNGSWQAYLSMSTPC